MFKLDSFKGPPFRKAHSAHIRAAGNPAGRVVERGSGSAQAPCPVGAPAEIHCSPGDVALIRDAAKQVDMAAYVLTDSAVIEALREASVRGVKVRIWRDPSIAERFGDYDVEAQLERRFRASKIGRTRPAACSCT
jgi:phosphatidylserine/phosphatidylglycerophosphate/cardiolipin synthase-like enzyme